MTGLLSQALANAQAAEKHIQALSGLPADAKKVQASSAALINKIVPEIQATQSAVKAFDSQATSQLQQASKELGQGGQPAAVKAMLLSVKTEATKLQTQVDAAANSMTSAGNEVAGYSNSLASIEAQLNQNKAALNGKLGNARSKEEAAKKKYYYLLALGPLGLVGLAAALALYEEMKKGVDKLEREESELSAQIAQQNQLITATKQLGKDFNDLVTKLSSVKNTVDFLAGDIENILNDVEKSDKPANVIELYIKAAEQQVITLQSDAS